MKLNYKEIGKSILTMIFFLNIGLIVIIGLTLLNIPIDTENLKALVIIDFVASLIVTTTVMILYNKMLKEDIKKIKKEGDKNWFKKFFDILLTSFLFFMVWKLVAGFIETFIFEILGLEFVTSDNQTLIEELADGAPVLMALSASILAPISEEVIFRGAIGKIIKNKKVFITVSGLIFGLMHVTGSTTLMIEILIIGLIINTINNMENKTKKDKIVLSVIATVIVLIISGGIYYIEYGNLLTKIFSLEASEIIGSIGYITMGLYLAYLYVKENNIHLCIGVHALNNAFSMIILLSNI